MELLPLILSVSRTCVERDALGQERLSRICRFCGFDTAGRQVACSPGGLSSAPADIVSACPLCALTQDLARSTIEQEAILVWLPEITQRALVAIVRSIHLTLHRHHIPAPMDRAPLGAGSAAVRGAWASYEALYERRLLVPDMLGTSSPSDLAAALLGLPPGAYQNRARALRGVRLLPRGRLFEAGADIYPDILAAWSQPAARPGATP